MENERGVVQYIARDGASIKLSPSIIKQYLVSGYPDRVTDQELYLYMGLCKSRGLNPFIRDCYLIKYGASDAAAIIVSIDYYRKRARAQADCKGWRCGIVVYNHKQEIERREGCIILDGEALLGGWFEATPDGWNDPIRKEVPLKRYIKKTREGKVTRFWSEDNQPEQICKVAESQGLRATWPDEFSGLYTDAERESMEAQAGFDQAVSGAAEAESKKEKLGKALGKPKDTTEDTGPAPEVDRKPEAPPKDTPKDEQAAPSASDEKLRASALYFSFDPYTEEVGKRYSAGKLLKLTDELKRLNIEFQKSWAGPVLHLALINGAKGKTRPVNEQEAPEPEPDPEQADEPDPEQADEPDPDDDPQVVQALRAELARGKMGEPELYRYAYTNQLTQGTVRPETKTSEMEPAECRAILQDLREQIDMRNASMTDPTGP